MRRHRPRLGCRSRSLRGCVPPPRQRVPNSAGLDGDDAPKHPCRRGRSRCQPGGRPSKSVVAGGVGPAFLAARVESASSVSPVEANTRSSRPRTASFTDPEVSRLHRGLPSRASSAYTPSRPPTYTEPRWTTGDTQMTRRLHPAASAASVLRRPPSRASTVPASPDSGLARRERTLDPRPRPGRSGHPRS